MVERKRLIGPFSEILSMRNLPLAGPINDDELDIIQNGGIIIANGVIQTIGDFQELHKENPSIDVVEISTPMVLMPGLIDAHTHICFAGSRATDYALRISGTSYLDIAKSGGGILNTVAATRAATQSNLELRLKTRCDILLKNGVTSCEVKSGYGLNVDDELKMLRSINKINQNHPLALIPTCLAAHTLPPEFDSKQSYLNHVLNHLLPKVTEENLSNRIDIFVEESAFSEREARDYLRAAKQLGFNITIHADQFSTSGSKLAVEFEAQSADHLEASGEKEIVSLAKKGIPGILLPGASMGLGLSFPKGRLMLDKGMCIAIASDWNPGSAPMGDLLVQAAVFGAYEKLSTAETFAAITYRAAHSLGIKDKGTIREGGQADMIAFPCNDYREILYHQGMMKPVQVWKGGKKC